MSAFFSKKYSWREGYSYKKPAQVVGAVMEAIEKRDGIVTAKSFLEESRPEEAETHDMFEWDDAVAAEQYRLSQSSRIINQISCEVIYEESPEVETTVTLLDDSPVEEILRNPISSRSAFVNVSATGRAKNSAVFVSIDRALSDADMRKQVLENALSALRAFRSKYAELKELAGVFKAIDEVLETEKGE